jgi:hypothetical protein
MWRSEHTAPSSASRDALWQLLSDPSRWPQWNPTIVESSIDGPFADGTTVTLKTHRGRTSEVSLRDVSQGSGFTTFSRLPGADLRIEHELGDGPDGRSLATERAVLEGPLARIWALLLGRQLGEDMTAATQALARAVPAAEG